VTRVLRLEHVQIAMPRGREAEARAFYAGVLDLPEVAKPAELAARGGCWFEDGAIKIHLGVERDFRPARKAHVALVVEDLNAVLAAVRALGCQAQDPEQAGAFLQAYVFDPFGNRIELLEEPSGGRHGGDA
jgi:catechol 2,3-dioxygenase-like lactoylglutathione lyase family enzyme